MGHPIHKHMGGMKSAERYDAKEAYNKDLSSKARMHYLENDIADKKGSPARMEGGRKDHKMSNSEYSAHLQSPKGKKEHGAGMSRYGSDYSDSPAELTAGGKKKIMASDANPAFKKAIANSPIDNVSYGDKSGKTGYIGGMSRYESVKKERKDLNTINPVDDKAGMSRYKSDAQRKAVHASKADKGMSRAKYGGNKGDESMSKRDY
tara:strand:+ start:50 stop:667 length:618 start_codon:yes stop_codon:yes gene_type:complete